MPLIRVQFVHRVNNPKPTYQFFPGSAEDISSLEATYRFCKRHKLPCGSKRLNRMGVSTVVLFPRDMWHSLILTVVDGE